MCAPLVALSGGTYQPRTGAHTAWGRVHGSYEILENAKPKAYNCKSCGFTVLRRLGISPDLASPPDS
eukprot:760624-Pyramimonas_sp.AAC.1